MKIKEKHKKEVAKLQELEQHLIKLITETNNDILMDDFLKWQKQREKCNGLFLEHLIELTKE